MGRMNWGEEARWETGVKSSFIYRSGAGCGLLQLS
jgi:hypothetical protein